MRGIDIVSMGKEEGTVVASYRFKGDVLEAVGGFDSVLKDLSKGLPAKDGSLVTAADGKKFIEAVIRRYESAAYMSVRVIE